MIDFSNSNTLAASVLLEELYRLGLRQVVISPGSRSTPLTVAAARHDGLTKSTHFDERGAAFYALGLARATGVAPALICTSGSALANYLPAVVEASNDDLPLILLTADRPPELQNCGANQTITQPGIYSHFVRTLLELECPHVDTDMRRVLQVVDRTWWIAHSQPYGPVHINCPFREPLAPNRNSEELSGSREQLAQWLDSEKPLGHNTNESPSVADADLTAAIDAINGAHRGLLVVGQLRTDEERDAVCALAKQFPWPCFIDALAGINRLMKEHPVPHHDLLLESSQFRQSYRPDVVLHLGGRFISKRLLEYIAAVAPEHCIQAKASPSPLDPTHGVTQRLIGNLTTTCKRLGRDCKPPESDRTKLWHQLAFEVTRLIGRSCEARNKLTEISAALFLGEGVPECVAMWAASSMPIRLIDRYVGSAHLQAANRGVSGIDGTVASACGYAVGGQIPVTLLIGDLALLHDLNSLSLLKTSEQPVIVVVFNNNGGRIFEHLPIAEHDDVLEPYFVVPHGLKFAAAARMFGLVWTEVGTVDQLKSAYHEATQAAVTSNASCIIEVHIDPPTNREHFRQIRDLIMERCRELLR